VDQRRDEWIFRKTHPALPHLKGNPVARSLYRQDWQPMILSNLDPDVAVRIRTMEMAYSISDIEDDLKRGGPIILGFEEEMEAMLMRALHGRAQPAVEFTEAQFGSILGRSECRSGVEP
jgi:hypothetical protein